MPRFAQALTITLAVGSALASPARADGPRPLARYFPRDNLAVYAEFDGFEAHADAWRKSAAYRLLTETAAGAMLEDLAAQFGERALASTRTRTLSADEARQVVEHAARAGFAFGMVYRPGENRPRCVGLVFRGAARGKVRAAFDKVIGPGSDPAAAKTPLVEKPGGRKLDVSAGPRGFAWWREGDDLAFSLASPEGADLMIDALDGRRPDATSHPGRAELARTEEGFTPLALAFLDVNALPPLPQAPLIGLDKVTRLDYRWGFQGDALVTITRAAAPAPRSGLLAALDQETFARKDVPPLPPGLTGLTAFSADPAGLYDRVAAGFAASNPANQAAFEAFETSVRDKTGQRLRDDILPLLGPKFVFYAVPARGAGRSPGSVLLVEARDAPKLAGLVDGMASRLLDAPKASPEAAPRPPAFRIHPLKGVAHGYTVSVSPTALPIPAGVRPTLVVGKRVLIVGTTPDAAKQALALEDRGGSLPADDPLAAPLNGLPDGLIFARVADDRRSQLPEIVANLPALIQFAASPGLGGLNPRLLALRMRRGFPAQAPGIMMRVQPQMGVMPPGAQPVGPLRLQIDPDRVPGPDDLRPFLFPSVYTLSADRDGFRLITREALPVLNPVAVAPVAVALLLPAAQSSRAAARRMQSVNNLKQIGLAFHNHHSVNNRFPGQAVVDKKGKPLLSWRVAILPFIEQQALYNEFKLDEPWDSPHNKALIARMPTTYALPGADAGPGKTYYRGFFGQGAFFDPKEKQGTPINGFVDGTSNTLAVVEARKAVTWTQPDEELPFDARAPVNAGNLLSMLGGHFPGGFNALFTDGSVRFIRQTVNPMVLRAIITRNSGEVVSSDSF